MVGNWYEVEDYSHGFLIVPLALYFAWERRGDLADARDRAELVGPRRRSRSASLTLAIGRLGVELHEHARLVRVRR